MYNSLKNEFTIHTYAKSFYSNHTLSFWISNQYNSGPFYLTIVDYLFFLKLMSREKCAWEKTDKE